MPDTVACLADGSPSLFPGGRVRAPHPGLKQTGSFRGHGSFLDEGSWRCERCAHHLPEGCQRLWHTSLLLALRLCGQKERVICSNPLAVILKNQASLERIIYSRDGSMPLDSV
jgi:hypothetical protein